MSTSKAVRVRLNGSVAKASPLQLSNYIYSLAERGYNIRVRYVSPLDFIPELPFMSRFFRLVLFRTGLWKRQLWLELVITPSK
jgi:hypothetical protein